MEKIHLDKDVKVICVQAKSFPEGIQEAFHQIEKISSDKPDRTFYGISYMQDGKIIYKAAVNEDAASDEGKSGLETFTIRKGDYIAETIKDFMKNIPLIGQTFDKFTSRPDIDRSGYCLEQYTHDGAVICMVRLAE